MTGVGGDRSRGLAPRWTDPSIVLLLVMSLAVTVGCSVPPSCDYGVADHVVFLGTLSMVGDDGRVELHVDHVDTIAGGSDAGTTDSTGATTPPSPDIGLLASVVEGATVAVWFPASQVDHLRRDVAKQYRVVAYPDRKRAALTATLQDMDQPCGETRYSDEQSAGPAPSWRWS